MGEVLGGSNAVGPSRLTVEKIKALRVDLDRILTIVDQSGFLRPKEQVLIKLKESRHWLGECLKELGNELPKEFQDKVD